MGLYIATLYLNQIQIMLIDGVIEEIEIYEMSNSISCIDLIIQFSRFSHVIHELRAIGLRCLPFSMNN